MKPIDIEDNIVYLVSTFIGDELLEIFVATSEDKMHEMADAIMEDNLEVDTVTSRTVVLDTIRLNETLH